MDKEIEFTMLHVEKLDWIIKQSARVHSPEWHQAISRIEETIGRHGTHNRKGDTIKVHFHRTPKKATLDEINAMIGLVLDDMPGMAWNGIVLPDEDKQAYIVCEQEQERDEELHPVEYAMTQEQHNASLPINAILDQYVVLDPEEARRIASIKVAKLIRDGAVDVVSLLKTLLEMGCR